MINGIIVNTLIIILSKKNKYYNSSQSGKLLGILGFFKYFLVKYHYQYRITKT